LTTTVLNHLQDNIDVLLLNADCCGFPAHGCLSLQLFSLAGNQILSLNMLPTVSKRF